MRATARLIVERLPEKKNMMVFDVQMMEMMADQYKPPFFFFMHLVHTAHLNMKAKKLVME